MSGLYTNSSGPDTVRNAFLKHGGAACEVLLAAPFFSYSDPVEQLLDRGSSVRLVVRLGAVTDHRALERVVRRDRAMVRYFTSPLFHSKLYIFGGRVALVGSANLTDAAMQSNREICVEVGSEDDRFDRLLQLFDTYWNRALVLDAAALDRYGRLVNGLRAPSREDELDRRVQDVFGDVAPESIRVGNDKRPRDRVYVETYRRTYQEFLSAYRAVEQAYAKHVPRLGAADVPLRIEVDQFLSFVRERFARGDSYAERPILPVEQAVAGLREYFDEWQKSDANYLHNEIPPHCRQVDAFFADGQTLRKATAQQIFDVFDVCHAFRERRRYFHGNRDLMRDEFFKVNDLARVKRTIDHLIFGRADYIERMADCIFSDEYSLVQFGRSGMQELFGWANRENVPICNGRTVKSLRYLGFNVVVYN